MNGQDKKFIEERLTILETKFDERWSNHDERWNNHDKRSDEIWNEIKKDIKNIYTLFSDIERGHLQLPCNSMRVKVTLIMIAIGFLYTLVATGIWYAIQP